MATPVLSETDLRVQYLAALCGRGRRTLGLNVLNLFNQAKGVGRCSCETDQGVVVKVDEADYYAGRVGVGAAIDDQKLRDPRFLKYASFQEPIKARVMVRVSFWAALSITYDYRTLSICPIVGPGTDSPTVEVVLPSGDTVKPPSRDQRDTAPASDFKSLPVPGSITRRASVVGRRRRARP